MWKVHKFGGASVKNSEGIRNVVKIIKERQDVGIIVISAIGKTTHHLEKLVRLSIEHTQEEALNYLDKILLFHKEICEQVFGEIPTELWQILTGTEKKLEGIIRGVFLLGEIPPRIHDRIMAFGELLSSRILSFALAKEGIPNVWLDARKLITTDPSYQKAFVRWDLTEKNVLEKLLPLLRKGKKVVIPGYIAATEEGKTTTLGREGSDFSAAIFANLTGADAMIVWKDVPGVLTEDPRENPEAELISELSYDDALKLTFFGAKILHPKTIAPLKRKQIPLFIKSFHKPQAQGTKIIEGAKIKTNIKAKIQNLVLLTLKKKDFSFLIPKDISLLFAGLDSAELLCYQTLFSGNEIFLVLENNSEGTERFLAFIQDDFFVLQRKRGAIHFEREAEDVEITEIKAFSESFIIKNKE